MILKQIREAKEQKRIIRDLIETYSTDDYQEEVLKRRFIFFQSFDTIADEMFMSLRNVFKLRRKGIQELTRRINQLEEKSSF